jgi:transcriptional regulator with XRE-family HTH domain
MMFLVNFSKNVRKIYKKQGLTQEQTAIMCNITPQYLRQIMKGEQIPSLAILLDVCIGLGVPPHELLGYDPAEFEKLCIARREEIDWKSIEKSRK